MVDVFHVETGATLRRFPVDAREICASGEYAMTPPAVVEEVEDSTDSDVTTSAPKRKR